MSKKCPLCGADMVKIFGFVEPAHENVIKYKCKMCGHNDAIEDAEGNRFSVNVDSLLNAPILPGVSIIEELSQKFVEQMEENKTKLVIQSCISARVDPDALQRAGEHNALLRNELEIMNQKYSWKSVEDKLPDKDGMYLVVVKSGITGYRYVTTEMFYGGRPFEHPVRNSVVTHWMECPELPEEGKADE